MQWIANWELGVEFQDNDHRQFVELLNAAEAAGDAEFPPLLRQLAEHSREHFAREDAMMRDCGFFAAHCHMGEHQRVLEEMAGVLARLEQGDLPHARGYVRDMLPAWFSNHLGSMDFVTAKFCLQRLK